MHKPLFKLLPFFVLSFLLTFAYAQQPPVRILRHIAMATDFEVIMYGASQEVDPEALLSAGRAAFEAVDALENRISNWKPDSYTSLVNRKAADGPVKVSADLIEILQSAKKIYSDTGGAFDVTVGPLIQFWKSQEKSDIFPDNQAVKPVLERIGLNRVDVNTHDSTVYFKHSDMHLDFGGIAKGLALDRMANVLIDNGVNSARLNAGSSTILAIGTPPGESGWTVDILSPYNNGEDEAIATVKIRDEALSTSANTVRYLQIGGKRYSHIFDPHTGMPVAGIVSATAIAPVGVESDALSTAFFVMGVQGTRAYCRAHPEVRAILVDDSSERSEPIFINFSDKIEKEL